MKDKAMGIAAAVICVLWILGLIQLVAGVVAGTMIVIGLMMTIEKIPGFWKFTSWLPGKLIVLAGTAWLTHTVFGADTIIGMIALAWSVLFKVLVIDAKTRAMRGY
jgi:hypothetical protein